MIFAEFTGKISKQIALILLLTVFIIVRFVNLENLFPFDYDQEIPAQAAYDFFVNKKLTLVGQELSFEGFFAGPLHNFIQFIPYGACNLFPDCTPYFYILLSLVAFLILFNINKKIFNSKIAKIQVLIYSFSLWVVQAEIGITTNYFIPLSTLLLIFCFYKYQQGKRSYLLLGCFIAGLATVNFNPIFIFNFISYLLFAMTLRINFRVFLLSLSVFAVNYLPLLIFNFRHQNLLLHSLLNFFNQNANPISLEKAYLILTNIQIPFYSNLMFLNTNLFFLVITLTLIMYGYIKGLRINRTIYNFLFLQMIVPIIGFTMYSGAIPDYYFIPTIVPMTILIATAVAKNSMIAGILLTSLFIINIPRILGFVSDIDYQTKKNAISYIVRDSGQKSFKVFFETPPGFNTGYSYLFKAYNKIPSLDGELLYILDIKNDQVFSIQIYQSAFKDKKVSVKSFGFIQVISVK